MNATQAQRRIRSAARAIAIASSPRARSSAPSATLLELSPSMSTAIAWATWYPPTTSPRRATNRTATGRLAGRGAWDRTGPGVLAAPSAEPINRRGLEVRFRLEPAGPGGGGECVVVTLVLVGIGRGEGRERPVECIALAQVGGDRDPVPQRAWARASVAPHSSA